MKNISIAPGSTEVANLAIDLFGSARVNPGNWTTPVCVVDLNDEEVSFAKEFFAEYRVRETPFSC